MYTLKDMRSRSRERLLERSTDQPQRASFDMDAWFVDDPRYLSAKSRVKDRPWSAVNHYDAVSVRETERKRTDSREGISSGLVAVDDGVRIVDET